MNKNIDNVVLSNIYLIVAMTEKSNSIGYKGDMLYYLKEDLKYFKNMTQNNTIVCGRKTYFSFPVRPLPNRKNIVLTKSDNIYDGCITLNSKKDVIKYALDNPSENIFISGGENIYKQFINNASKLYVTLIDEDEKPIADTFFPTIDEFIWKLDSISDYIIPENAPRYRFAIFVRKD